ncbi:MAG: HAMP domain-containing sensor histidine kinase [Sphingomonas sp.]
MVKLPSTTAFRLAAYFSAAFTVLTLVLGASIYFAMRNELRYDLDQRVIGERAAVLREAADDDVGLFRAVAGRAEHERSDMRYALLDPAGVKIAGQRIMSRPSPGWSHMNFVDSAGTADDTRVLASRTADGGTLIVGADPEAIEELDQRMVPMFVAAFALIATIGVAGAFVLSRVLQRRLDAMNRTAEAIIAGDLASRMRLTGNGDEFDRLSTTLNLMLDRIAGLLDNLRQVSGDVAHDLRTPLTRLRQKLEAAAAGPDKPMPLKAAIDEAIEQTDDMLALFAAILGISEVEAGGAGLRMRSLDLSALVSDLADSYQPSVEDAGRVLTRDIAPGIHIEGNRELLAQAGVNLLDNALLHTPPGTDIALSLTERDGTIKFAVSDRGAGIALEDRERVFARFARLESSRSTPGHGLGLSLVAAIARAHGGAADLQDHQPGTTVMLSFPRRSR